MFYFSKLVHVPHIYIYSIDLTPNSVEYRLFQAVSKVFGTAEAVFTRHIRPMSRTYPASQTCLGLGFLAYIRVLSAPLEP
jgi:hypothetical protein